MTELLNFTKLNGQYSIVKTVQVFMISCADEIMQITCPIFNVSSKKLSEYLLNLGLNEPHMLHNELIIYTFRTTA